MNINYKYTTWALLALLLIMIIGACVRSSLHYKYGTQGGYDNDMMYEDDGNGEMMGNNGMMMRDGNNKNNKNMNHMKMMMNMMTMNMQGKTGKELEYAFLTDMIPHHQGAVEMAQMLLKDASISRELKTFSEKIITAQTGEIEQMNMWLKTYSTSTQGVLKK